MNKIIEKLFIGACLSVSIVCQSQTLTVKGSDALYFPLSEVAIGFSKDNIVAALEKSGGKPLDGPMVKVSGSGSTLGIIDFEAGLVDMCSSTRDLTDSETKAMVNRGINLRKVLIAKEALALLVNKDNPVQKLTELQVKDIFTGKIKNWKDIFSQDDLNRLLLKKRLSNVLKERYKLWVIDQPIKVYIRSNTTGCYMGFKNQFLNDADYGVNCMMLSNNTSIKMTIKSHKNAISFLGFLEIDHQSASVIAIGKDTASAVKPTTESIQLLSYPYLRNCYLFYDASNEIKCRPFVDYVLDYNKGQQILLKKGFIPVSHIE